MINRIIWGGTVGSLANKTVEKAYDEYDILGCDYLTMLSELEKKTNIDSNTIKLDDKETLEMFNREFLKEKSEIKDDYNLINSRAIADYCRSIRHKFNTEELAVLVYRNQRMSLEEKIAKYNDLIKNYHDMEVIERINCKHYSSVKTMIKDEIKRIKILNKKLIQDDENSIYTWTEFNKSTQKYEHSGDIDHIG